MNIKVYCCENCPLSRCIMEDGQWIEVCVAMGRSQIKVKKSSAIDPRCPLPVVIEREKP